MLNMGQANPASACCREVWLKYFVDIVFWNAYPSITDFYGQPILKIANNYFDFPFVNIFQCLIGIDQKIIYQLQKLPKVKSYDKIFIKAHIID